MGAPIITYSYECIPWEQADTQLRLRPLRYTRAPTQIKQAMVSFL